MTAIAICEVLKSVKKNGRDPSIRFGDWWHHQNFYSGQLTLSAVQTTLTEIGYARQTTG
jgi:hypothetical protein